MKARESGMPEEGMWAEFFDAEAILRKLGLSSSCGDVVDFGCGYGTFTIPAARMVSGKVHALDIEPEMVQATAAKAQEAGLQNVKTYLRDFVAQGSGLPPASAEYAMLFNILHADRPDVLLEEAFRVLSAGRSAGGHPLELRSGHAARAVDGHPTAARAVLRLGRRGRVPASIARDHRSATLPLWVGFPVPGMTPSPPETEAECAFQRPACAGARVERHLGDPRRLPARPEAVT